MLHMDCLSLRMSLGGWQWGLAMVVQQWAPIGPLGLPPGGILPTQANGRNYTAPLRFYPSVLKSENP